MDSMMQDNEILPENYDHKTYVTESKLNEAVEILKKVAKNQAVSNESISKKPLFEDDLDFVFLQLDFKKIPLNYSTFIHFANLPFHWRHEQNFETCLIVKDYEKEPLSDREADLQRTRQHYRDMFDDESNEMISEILPMRQLTTEFKLPALKRKLSSEYNVFLCDKKLISNKHSFLSRFLGKAFWVDNKKVPFLIDLKKDNFKEYLNEKLDQTTIYVSGKGSTISICVGSLRQDTTKLVKNLVAVLIRIQNLFGSNVRELKIKTEKSMAILFFMDLGSANEIQLIKSFRPKEFVEDEFDFLTNSNIKIYKDGSIQLVLGSSDQSNLHRKELNLIKSINKSNERYWKRRVLFSQQSEKILQNRFNKSKKKKSSKIP
ncbi:hypothetical protein NH340_JMT06541 [Sarcoptes scabiei]|nr:hypothetical protein NH340_JMT06541 [Sarcoptes scabiei]